MRLSRAMLLALVAMVCFQTDARADWWKPGAGVKKFWSSSSTATPSSSAQPAARTASSTNSRVPTAPQQSNLTFAPAPSAPQPSVSIPAATSPAGPVATSAPKRRWGGRIASAASATRDALTIKPREVPVDDPVRLSGRTSAAPAPVNVSAARVWESQGRVKEAADQYNKALAADPKNVDALVGLARLQHREGDLVSATELYQRALRADSNNAVVLNDLGLCYARRGMLEQARQSMEKAVAQDPRSKLYRNNLAVVFVEMNQPEAALGHLKLVHGEAVAHYNLGYMLQEKGQTIAAVQHMQTALAIEPRMEPARQMLAQMQPQPAPNVGPQLGAPQLPPQQSPQYQQPEVQPQQEYPVNYRQPVPQHDYVPADGGLPPASGEVRLPHNYPSSGPAHMSLSDDQPAPAANNVQPPVENYRPTVNYVQPPIGGAQPPANYVFPPVQQTAPPAQVQPPAEAPLPGEMPAYIREPAPQESAQPPAIAPAGRPSRWSN